MLYPLHQLAAPDFASDGILEMKKGEVEIGSEVVNLGNWMNDDTFNRGKEWQTVATEWVCGVRESEESMIMLTL